MMRRVIAHMIFILLRFHAHLIYGMVVAHKLQVFLLPVKS